MQLYFVTGNSNKFEEAQLVFPNIQQLDIDLPEIQSLDPEKILSAKIEAASMKTDKSFIIEDQEFYITGMNKLPGPYIKWFMEAIGNEGLVRLSEVFGSNAQAKTTIGFRNESGETHFFDAIIKGKIVPPRGELGWGWDPIFEPEGYDKTYGEMTMEEKTDISMRRIALQKLKDFLNKQPN